MGHGSKIEILSGFLSHLVNSLTESSLCGSEEIHRLEQAWISAQSVGRLPIPLSEDEFQWVGSSIRGRLDALLYLQAEQRRERLALTTADDCYAIVVKYCPDTVDESIENLSANLRFVLFWLYSSLKAYADYGLKERTRNNLKTIPRDLLSEAFQIIEQKIEKRTGSEDARREVKSYLEILFRKIRQ
jgi:hypothetical protein